MDADASRGWDPDERSDRCRRSFVLPTLSALSRIHEAGEAKILIDPFLSDNPSRDNGWSGYLTGKNSTQGGDR